MTWPRIELDMDAVRALHAKGWSLKAIAARFGVHYNTMQDRTAKAGLRFKNCPKRRILGSRCVHGHLLTVTNSKLVERKGKTYRVCIECSKLRPPKKPRPEMTVFDAARTDNDRTRRILDLCEERERAATWWEREAIARRIDALRA